MACIPMDHSFGNPAQKFVDHNGFVFFWHTVECLLDHMATKRIHTEAQSIALDSIRNGNNLLRGSVFEAALDKKVSKPIYHERVRLLYDGFDYIIFLLCGPNFELLLQKYRGLLVIVANDLVHYILPITGNVLIEKAPVVEWLKWRNVRLGGIPTDLSQSVKTQEST